MMAHLHKKSGSDWVGSRLDELRADAFRQIQEEKAADAIKRKASFSLLDSKAEAALKHKLYKLFDAIYDTIWLRFVFIASTKFPNAAGSPQGNLLLLSSIALEVRAGTFDLLAMLARIRGATKGATTGGGAAQLVEQTVKSAKSLHGLANMQQRLTELASEVKMKLVQSLDGVRSPERAGRPVGSSNGAASSSSSSAATTLLPPLIETPILLFEERIKHFPQADRDALIALCPPLRDLRQGLVGLYQLRCDDAIVALNLADILGDSYWRVMQSASAREDFAGPLLAAFLSSRASAWMILRDLHDLDLATTARAGLVPQASRSRLIPEAQTKVYGASSGNANGSMPAVTSATTSPTLTPSQPSQQALPTFSPLPQTQPQVVHPTSHSSAALASRPLPPIPVSAGPASSDESQAPMSPVPILSVSFSASANGVHDPTSPPPLLHAASSNGAERSPRMSPASAAEDVHLYPTSPQSMSTSLVASPEQAALGGSARVARERGSSTTSSAAPATQESQGRGHAHADSIVMDAPDFNLPTPPVPPAGTTAAAAAAATTISPNGDRASSSSSTPSSVSTTSSSAFSPSPSPAVASSRHAISSATASPVARNPGPPLPLPDDADWQQVTNEGKTFWYNSRTKVSAWTKPLGPAAAEGFAARLQRLATVEDSNEDGAGEAEVIVPVAISPAVTSFAAATPKACAIAGCASARFAGRPYCVAHLTQQ